MKIYVVMGSTGEYSDRGEWPVKAFASESAAADLVVKATARAKEIEIAKESAYVDPPGGANEHDPDMQMQYTGTHYFVYTVELVS